MTIHPDLFRQGPMLCSASKEIHPDVDTAVRQLVDGGNHVFDTKYDGIRCLAYVSDGEVTLINRRGIDITYRYPEIHLALLQAYASTDVVLDSEIVVLDARGNANFAATHRRDAQSGPQAAAKLAEVWPATLMAFDILHFDGNDFRPMPYKARHALLSVQSKVKFAGTMTLQWSQPCIDGIEAFNRARATGQEGLVAKALGAPYRAGRASAWIKCKVAYTVSCVAVGYTEGKGARRGMIGAVKIRLVKPDGSLYDCGEVGTGFNHADLRDLQPRIDAGEMLVFEVELTGVYKDEGKFRFPSYKGLRTDVDPVDCTTDQLDGIPVIE